ncbi:hypothetical protein LH51_12275 [Nitrincola sp. A-D6]|uniref:hypothetical protein n=1 Tax=Nitrincola sp. A-D6 TaxID=1545442 RepID=UPI00051FE4CC|nr:hypothetical protein [Nitrincola sp. A-D6]KGK41797.1 hypothetical protein LH51_12275 [Nitrincola sp. A-D6]
MEQFIPEGSSVQSIREMIRSAAVGEVFCCRDVELFETAKVALVAEKVAGICIQLVDDGDYVVRQVSSKRRADQKKKRSAQ